MSGSVTIVRQGVPNWVPWATFVGGIAIGFILALAAVIVRAEMI